MKKISTLFKRKNELANKPQEMFLRGWNKNYGWVMYECPKCELPHDNFWFKKNNLKPGKVFTCELCGAELRVPNFPKFLSRFTNPKYK